MKKLPNSLLEQAANYQKLDDDDKYGLFVELYGDRKLSWANIAKLCGTYSNKVRRDATKLGIQSRDKSEAQSAAIESGRHGHPTKGKGHSEQTKIKISESVAEDWSSLPEVERESRRLDAKRRWDEKSDDEIREFRKAAHAAIKEASIKGSALEKYLLKELIDKGYQVQFHREHYVVREKLQIDLFIPSLNVAIEVDGPSHFNDIWGEDVLAKNKQRDLEKNGLLLQRGCVIIRVKQTKRISNKFKRDVLKDLLKVLEQIKIKVPTKGNRCIYIGE